MIRNAASILTLLFVSTFAAPARALEPDGILLIVNQNVPESRALADFYVTARQIPQGRILELDLPRGEDMSLLEYERDVVPRVREFLTNAKLVDQVKCLVTFYGVPLRINPRVLTAEERRELARIEADFARLLDELKKFVAAIEAEVRTISPQYQPEQQGEHVDQLAARADAALRLLWQRAVQTPDKQLQSQRINALAGMIQRAGGAAGVLQAFGAGAAANDEGKAALKQMQQQVAAAAAEVKKLEDRRYEPESRERLRKLVAAHFGLIYHARLLQLQQDYLAADKSSAAFDSELALLWWPHYKRSHWHINPLNHAVEARGRVNPTMMVMRLDAPQSGMVRDIILASLRAERDGLKGKVVLDSRGIDAAGDAGKFGGYGWYDQSIRNLARFVRTKTRLPLLHDDSNDLLPPKSADNVAIYCGWYSVRNYVPSVQLAPGAVGFHVASFELASLRNPDEKGWVPNLIRDGIVASLGSVDEPYLASFPQADEFFPLLFTGKLTLAEVYWRTTPYTSWMIAMIGDPLYRPFAKNPAVLPDALPAPLQRALEMPATPSTQPATTRPASAPANPQ
jgi:uncharacterized protein (TIGR03790 family)